MDDLISRHAAIMHFVKVSKNYECGMFDLKEVTHELWQLPSAQSERKTGKWLFPYEGTHYKKCSVCGSLFYSIPNNAKFCMNCGSFNGGEKDVDE